MSPLRLKERAAPVPYAKFSLQLSLLTALRIVLVPVIAVGTLFASAQLFDAKFDESYVALAVIAALLCWIFLSREETQRPTLHSSGFAVAGQIGFGWLAVVGALLLIGYATKSSDTYSRRALFVWFVATPPLLVVASLIVRQCLRMVMLSAANARNVVIVGANRMSLALARTIHQRPELGLKLHCFFDPSDCDSHVDPTFTVRRDFDCVRDYVNEHHIDVVFLALPVESETTQRLLNDLRDTTASVYMVPDISLFDLIQAQAADIQGIPIIALCESPFHGIRGTVKRATDIIFALVMLLIASPVMLAIAAAIKLTSPGRVLFKQDRYGLDGERIVVYKFRTMTVAENGRRVVQAKPNDSRVTPVGRFLRRTSLDELPQLINVLQGHMSLVGPRPHAVAHNEEYRKLISGYMVRHKVTPGITGLAQVNGCRGETSSLEDMRRRVDYDLEYLRHWCWLLDVKILFRTLVLMFRDKHAY
jgi:putative colanic acid biosynthesis UDP-glucose lipid carrier transferase